MPVVSLSRARDLPKSAIQKPPAESNTRSSGPRSFEGDGTSFGRRGRSPEPSGGAIGPSENPRPWQTTASVETSKIGDEPLMSVQSPARPLKHATIAGVCDKYLALFLFPTSPTIMRNNQVLTNIRGRH